jgi:hypothetical protein
MAPGEELHPRHGQPKRLALRKPAPAASHTVSSYRAGIAAAKPEMAPAGRGTTTRLSRRNCGGRRNRRLGARGPIAVVAGAAAKNRSVTLTCRLGLARPLCWLVVTWRRPGSGRIWAPPAGTGQWRCIAPTLGVGVGEAPVMAARAGEQRAGMAGAARRDLGLGPSVWGTGAWAAVFAGGGP